MVYSLKVTVIEGEICLSYHTSPLIDYTSSLRCHAPASPMIFTAVLYIPQRMVSAAVITAAIKTVKHDTGSLNLEWFRHNCMHVYLLYVIYVLEREKGVGWLHDKLL